MCHKLLIAALIACLAAQSATTRPADNPAKQRAEDVRRSLVNAEIESVIFRFRSVDVDRSLRLEDRAEIAVLVERITAALAADDLREGKQEHQPSSTITMRFVLTNVPDVVLNSVGMDMFWTAQCDGDPDPRLDWVNLQSPALTEALREAFERLQPTTRPIGIDDGDDPPILTANRSQSA